MQSPQPKRKPRLLLVTRTMQTGGTERHLAQIAPGLARRGFDVTLYSLAKEGALAEEVGARGIRILGSDVGSHSVLGNALTLASGALGLVPEMLLRKPDIAHFFLPHAFIAGSVAAAIGQVPVRVMSRRCLNHYQRKHPRLAALESRLLSSMTAVLGNSQAVCRDLLQEGAAPARTGLIYNGTDLSAFPSSRPAAATRATLGIPAGACVLSIVANLIGYKGHADLLQALALIRERLPNPWRLLVIGRDSGRLAALRAQSSALGLDGNVLWLGARTDVPDLLAASDVGVLASHEEGFSNAVIESMAAGLPMVVTDVGGNAEAVMHGHTGLVVPARDPAAMAQSLLALATDPDRAKTMGHAGRLRAEARFSLSACLDSYEAMYRSLLSGKALPQQLRVRSTADGPIAPARRARPLVAGPETARA
jgi:glycosyltransferase involved in cell wall biosynthesis